MATKTATLIILVLVLAFSATAQGLSVNLKTDEKVIVSISPKTAANTAAVLDAPPVVTCANEAVAKSFLPLSHIPLSWEIRAVAVGSTTCTVSATSSGNALSETIAVTVVDATAVTLGVSLGSPIKK
jgi:hypothetical protein